MSTEKIDPSIAPRAHWRDPESYQSLLDLDRIGWAWEWLRRNPDFATAAGRPPKHCLQPLRPPPSCRDVVTQPRIIRVQKREPFDRWGIVFHQRHRSTGYRGILASRLQSVRARR